MSQNPYLTKKPAAFFGNRRNGVLLKLRPEAFCVRRVDVQPTVHYLRVLCDGSRRLQRNFKTQDLVNTSKQKPADSLSLGVAWRKLHLVCPKVLYDGTRWCQPLFVVCFLVSIYLYPTHFNKEKHSVQKKWVFVFPQKLFRKRWIAGLHTK